MKPGLQQEDCSKEGRLVSLQSMQLQFTWNFHRGPKILHLLRLIFSIASCLEEGRPWGGCTEAYYSTQYLSTDTQPTDSYLYHTTSNIGGV